MSLSVSSKYMLNCIENMRKSTESFNISTVSVLLLCCFIGCQHFRRMTNSTNIYCLACRSQIVVTFHHSMELELTENGRNFDNNHSNETKVEWVDFNRFHQGVAIRHNMRKRFHVKTHEIFYSFRFHPQLHTRKKSTISQLCAKNPSKIE